MDTLELTEEWDMTFPQSDKVEHSKITFHNRYVIPFDTIDAFFKKHLND